MFYYSLFCDVKLMEERPSNPFVFTKKTVYMQRIGDAVSKGATRYIQGVVPIGGSYHIAAKSAICGSSSHVNLTNTIKTTSYDFLLLANTR